MTNNRGEWSGRNLPPEPLRILVTRKVAPLEIANGAYDTLATAISASDVRVVVVE